MKKYLVERTVKEFNELDIIYSDLFNRWGTVWDNTKIHNKLYSCYTRLKIVSVLLRTCIDYGLIKNINLKTKEDYASLKMFCNYCIHHSSCVYEDNRRISQELEVYLIINTDVKEKESFIINKNIIALRKLINNLASKEPSGKS